MSTYAETEALLAVMEDDPARAEEILREFYPGELRTFADQVESLAGIIDRVARIKE